MERDKMFKKIAVVVTATLLLAGCSGGINSVEEAQAQLATATSPAEVSEALEYLMEHSEEIDEFAAVPAPVEIVFNPAEDVTMELRGKIGAQVGDDLREYDGNPRIVRLSVNVKNTSNEPLSIPEYGTGFDVYEGAGQFPVDQHPGYFGYEDITGIERMPTLIGPNESVEFANSYIFTEEDNWNATFSWSADDGSYASTTEAVTAP